MTWPKNKSQILKEQFGAETATEAVAKIRGKRHRPKTQKQYQTASQTAQIKPVENPKKDRYAPPGPGHEKEIETESKEWWWEK